MNALAHCVEARLRHPALAGGRGHRPRRRAARIARRAARGWSTTRPTSAARTDLLAGAALAGRALQNATMGVHHGLSQLLGGRTGIPHGLANALVLPCGDALQRAGRARGDGRHRPRARRRATTPPRPSSACGRPVGLPARLRDVGVTEDDLDAVARLSQGEPRRAAQPAPGQRGRRPGHPRRRLVSRPRLSAGVARSASERPRARTSPATGSTSTSMPSCSSVERAAGPDDGGDAELAGQHGGVAQRAALDRHDGAGQRQHHVVGRRRERHDEHLAGLERAMASSGLEGRAHAAPVGTAPDAGAVQAVGAGLGGEQVEHRPHHVEQRGRGRRAWPTSGGSGSVGPERWPAA